MPRSALLSATLDRSVVVVASTWMPSFRSGHWGCASGRRAAVVVRVVPLDECGTGVIGDNHAGAGVVVSHVVEDRVVI
jgi:hypothetical protein